MDSKVQIRRAMRDLGPESDPGFLWSNLKSMDEFRNARTVLMFWSIQGEPFTHEFLRKLAGTKRVALPRVIGTNLELREFDPEMMVPGYRGIMEPGPEASLISPSEVDFAVIPGVAFDRNGGRLGHGKGYYDRLLPMLHCCKAGVCLDSHMVDRIPVESHDISVDVVITPNNLYICK